MQMLAPRSAHGVARGVHHPHADTVPALAGSDHHVLQPGVNEPVPRHIQKADQVCASTDTAGRDPAEAVAFTQRRPVPFLIGKDTRLERPGMQCVHLAAAECSTPCNLDVFHAMGLRMMLPAYNNRNAICDGCLEPDNAGLSRMGRGWVEACNRLGIVMDMTHVGERATMQVLELTRQPVVFSHSNPRGLVDNDRNVSDEQIKACAATGGVIAPTNWGPLNLRAGSTTRPTASDYIDAIDYIVDLVGIDHVGIGTDMSHGTYPDGDKIRGLASKRIVGGSYASHIEKAPRSRLRYVEGFDDYGQLPDVVKLMKGRGYSEEDVAKILGGNYLRVFRQVWGG